MGIVGRVAEHARRVKITYTTCPKRIERRFFRFIRRPILGKYFPTTNRKIA